MKMTRKILALLLSVVMVLSLAACGKQNDGTNTGDSTNTGDDANTGDTTAKVTLQVAYENNPGEPISDAVEEWKRLVEDRSNGTIELQLFPSSQLGSKSDLMDQIVMGEPIITVCDGSFLASYGAPELDITSAPYVFDNFDQCWKVIASDWWTEQCGLLEQNGIHIVTTNWIFGERNIITTKPVKSVDDMKGLILRTPNTTSYVTAFQLMGAAPTAMAIGDCYTALQQGTIDGLENTYSTLYGSAFYEVAKYVTTTHHVNMFCQWIMSETLWESLTDEQRTILAETGDGTDVRSVAFYHGGAVGQRLRRHGPPDGLALGGVGGDGIAVAVPQGQRHGLGGCAVAHGDTGGLVVGQGQHRAHADGEVGGVAAQGGPCHHHTLSTGGGGGERHLPAAAGGVIGRHGGAADEGVIRRRAILVQQGNGRCLAGVDGVVFGV